MANDIKLFSDFNIRSLTLKNRVVISPMGTYSADNGQLQPFHHTHYAAFAMGGAGLVMVEQTSVTRRGRVTNGDPGLWEDSQIAGMRAMKRPMALRGTANAICQKCGINPMGMANAANTRQRAVGCACSKIGKRDAGAVHQSCPVTR